MLLKGGSVSSYGTYEELTATGYNIKDILDSYNNSMTQKNAGEDKQKFTDEKKKTAGEIEKDKKVDEAKKDAAKDKDKTHDAAKDLIVEEDKFDEGVGVRDYLNLFSFSIGCWALLIFAIISIVSAALQLAPSYLLVIWSKKTIKEQ